MASSNYLKNIAIVGAAGNSGRYMTEELLKTTKYNVTAISRIDSSNKFPDGVKVIRVDYTKPESLIEAFRGQDALIITMNVFVDRSQQDSIMKAAGEAGVKWIVPNDWAPDTTREDLVRDVAPFQGQVANRKLIESEGKSAHLSITCGFWYEWSMSIPPAFGFDLLKRQVTFFDDGQTKLSISTWPQVGRAVAALLSLPIKEEGDKKGASLENFKNQNIFINSFTVNQKEMFESVLRVTNTKESEWKISYEQSQERYKAGLSDMKKGDHTGFMRMMYSRVFFPDGNGNFEKSRGVSNDLLGLPKENIDDATRAAIERADKVFREGVFPGKSKEDVSDSTRSMT